MNHRVLKLDINGSPSAWVSFEEAAKCIVKDKVSWYLGDSTRLHGGVNMEGDQSFLDVPYIIAVKGDTASDTGKYRTLALSNRRLFIRDDYTCQYCAKRFAHNTNMINKDHVTPTSLGGPDVWTNVVTSCKRCNTFKDNRTPEQAGMKLIAVPFAPNRYEGFILKEKNPVKEQIDYLASKFTSPILIERYAA